MFPWKMQESTYARQKTRSDKLLVLHGWKSCQVDIQLLLIKMYFNMANPIHTITNKTNFDLIAKVLWQFHLFVMVVPLVTLFQYHSRSYWRANWGNIGTSASRAWRCTKTPLWHKSPWSRTMVQGWRTGATQCTYPNKSSSHGDCRCDLWRFRSVCVRSSRHQRGSSQLHHYSDRYVLRHKKLFVNTIALRLYVTAWSPASTFADAVGSGDDDEDNGLDDADPETENDQVYISRG